LQDKKYLNVAKIEAMEDRIKEDKKTSRLFGILFLFCLVSMALGFYWYFTKPRSIGILACAVMLSLLCAGSFTARYFYSNRAKNLTQELRNRPHK